MSFNAFLLSKFTNHLSVGTEIPSLIKRYQALWAIYINLLMLTAVVIWKTMNILFSPTIKSSLLIFALPSFFFAFVSLKKDKSDFTAIFTLISIHLVSFATNEVSCLASSHFAVVCPVIGFYLTSSKKIQFSNIGICVVQNMIHIWTMNERFRVTLTEQQNNEIFQYQIASFLTIGVLSVLSYVQKFIKTNLWQLAQSNYKKTEEIAKEVVQAAKAKDTFVSSLSHEIRNPLNCMNGSIDYLLRVIKDPSHIQILNNAKVSGEVLLNLLNNVLDAAKLKSDKMEISYMETSSLDFLKKVLAIYSEKFKEKHLSVNMYIDRSLPPMIWIDPARLLQIMINLFSNSLKFTSEKGKIYLFIAWVTDEQSSETLIQPIKPFFENNNPESHRSFVASTQSKTLSLDSLGEDLHHDDSLFIDEFDVMENELRSNNLQYLKAQRTEDLKPSFLGESKTKFNFYHIDDKASVNMSQFNGSSSSVSTVPSRRALENKKGYLKVQITDTGCGIAEENISKLFEMFGQADHTVGSIHGGTGLGLWLCKQLCQKMGGDIMLYSQLHKGTTFVFYLPIDNNMISNTAAPNRAHGHGEQLKALVVDDYAYNRDVHKLILEKENVQVTVASNGIEAVQAYTNHPEDYFQLILMDVKMPLMDGFVAAKKIREFEEEQGRKRADIYFISGEYYNEEEVMREMRKEGGIVEVTGIKCLKKPIDVEKIRRILTKYTTRKRKNTVIRMQREVSNPTLAEVNE